MPEIKTSGYKRFWPLRQFEGRELNGATKSTEGFRDMLSGEFHAPENGWAGQPPAFPVGERTPRISNCYAKNYDLIKWDKRDKHAAKECELL